jgi:aldose sugar dehydrogenase
MKSLFSKPLLAVAPFAAAAVYLALTAQTGGIALRAQDDKGAVKEGAPAPGRGPGRGQSKGQGKGRGPGRGATDTLGEGPWDFMTEQQRIHVSVVTKGLDHPWGMAFLPNGDMLVTERPGRLRVVRNGKLDPTPIAGLPAIRAVTLGGLLDIALHPNFAQNHWIYFTYSKPGTDDPAHAVLAVGRAKYDGGDSLSDVKDIFIPDAYWGGQGSPRGCCGQGPSDGSYGSRLLFDKEGMLLVTSGDRNYGEKAQDPSSDIGKILRIRDDGTIPPDNPFVGKAGYKPEIYTIGNRNPLGLTMNSATGEIWESEFGPRGGDEVNRIKAGGNYGWIKVTHGEHYNGDPSEKSAAGMEEPVLHWEPSINPGNLVIYNGDKFPAWKGNLLMGVMGRFFLRVTFDAQGNPVAQERMLADLKQRIRDTRIGPDGFIYLLTDETFGAMLKIEPAQ